MKNQTLFIGTLLICVGGIFLLESFQLPFLHLFLKWPTILLILGIAYFVQGTAGKEQQALFPSVILCGLSLHFLFSPYFTHWPKHWAVYTLIFGIAFLTQKRQGLKVAFLLITFSLFTLFYSDFQLWQAKLLTYLNGYWHLLLIGLGIYLIVKKSR